MTQWNRYFTRRERPPTTASELDAYWREAEDPDGNLRRPHEEREQRLLAVRAELAFIAALPAGRVLDVGCGVGTLLSALSDSWEKHGVEPSAFAAREASRYARVHRGALESARYPSAHFDLLVLHHVIEHMADPVAAIRECFRILKADGKLLVGTPDFDSACARRFGQNFRLLHDPTHISLFTRDSLRRLLEDEGFTIEDVDVPYFDTPYFTEENLLRLFDTSAVSPPFVGNVVTFYCRKPQRHPCVERLALASRFAANLSERCPDALAQLAEWLEGNGDRRGTWFGVGTELARETWRRLSHERRARAGADENTVSASAPGDLLFVFDLGEATLPETERVLQRAAERAVPRVCFTRRERAPAPGLLCIEVPSADAHVTDLGLNLTIEALCVGACTPR